MRSKELTLESGHHHLRKQFEKLNEEKRVIIEIKKMQNGERERRKKKREAETTEQKHLDYIKGMKKIKPRNCKRYKFIFRLS